MSDHYLSDDAILCDGCGEEIWSDGGTYRTVYGDSAECRPGTGYNHTPIPGAAPR